MTATPTRTPLQNTHRIRSFGRVAARLTDASLAKVDAALAPFCLPPLATAAGMPLPQAWPTPSTWAPGTTRLVLDLGCGRAEWSLARAAVSPTTAFVACDVFRNGLTQIARAITAQSLTNLKLYPRDGREILAVLPAASVAEVVVLYPDPWPKARHHKRRLVQPAFLAEVVRCLQPGGVFFLATDIPSYAHAALAHLYACAGLQPVGDYPTAWATPPADWVPSAYERKARQAGRQSWYLRFEKKPCQGGPTAL